MSKIRRFVATLGASAIGGAIAVMAASFPALALTPAEVARKLENIPVFALFNPELNNYPSASFEVEGETVSLVLSYVDRLDAEKILAEQRRINEEIGEQVTVRPIPLSRVFLEIQNSKDKGEQPLFQVIPDGDEIQKAVEMRTSEGQKDEGWRGIPLFYTPNLGLTQTTPDGASRQILPMFFSRTDLDNYVVQAKKENPDIGASEVALKVTTLENVLNTLLNEEDPALSQVEFMPPRDSLEFIIQEQRRSANPAPAAAPAQ